MPAPYRRIVLDEIAGTSELVVRLSTGVSISLALDKLTGMVVIASLPVLASISVREALVDFQFTTDWLSQALDKLDMTSGLLGDIQIESKQLSPTTRRLELTKSGVSIRIYTYDRTAKTLSASASSGVSLKPIDLQYWLSMVFSELTLLGRE